MSDDETVASAANVVGAVLLRDGRLLLGLRSADKAECPACWDVIGGRLEKGESFEAACIREIEEEIGVQAELDAEILRADLPSGGAYRIFLVTRWAGEPRIANAEHAELGWFTPEEAGRLKPLAAQEYIALFKGLSADRIA